MGKKSNKSKAKRKYNLSEGKFRNKICKNCQVCNSPAKSFCYQKYLENPHMFWRDAVPHLQALTKGWLSTANTSYAEELDLFTCIFCDNVCIRRDNNVFGDCLNAGKCFGYFESQLMDFSLDKSFAYSGGGPPIPPIRKGNAGVSKRSIKAANKASKKAAKKAAKLANMLPKKATFFNNNDDVWKIRIEKVFNANKDSEQNQTGESSGAT